MKIQRGIPFIYGGSPRCDKCHTTNLHLTQYFHHCATCKYDLCSRCTDE